MNFSQLRTEICDEIESILACYWASPRLPSLQPAPGSMRPGTKRQAQGKVAMLREKDEKTG